MRRRRDARVVRSSDNAGVLILLPPSETKAPGGSGEPLDPEQLSFPQLAAARTRITRSLTTLGRSPKRAATVLGLGPRQAHELEHNVRLAEAPTMPAIERYTGVLYDSLDIASIRGAARSRAMRRLAVGSALFGLVRASDPIPAYRLSAGTKLPRVGTLASVWKPALTPVLATLAEQELVVDLRSGAYRSLAPVRGAVEVRVLNERADGARSVVSHFNKSTKGELARLLASTPRECQTVDEVVQVAEATGFEVERPGELELDVILRDPHA
jgi:cytoplasmic iron level regulating protein YaaA (DUF328/UPF0246 family)